MLTYESSPALRAAAQSFVRAEAATLFPSAPGLAMWACESAWGSKLTGDFNYFGITRYPEEGPAKLCDTHEDITTAQLAGFRSDEQVTAVFVKALGGGKVCYAMKRWFASYASLDEAVADYIKLFTNSPKRYVAAWQTYMADRVNFPNTAAASLLKAICEDGYATGDAETVELQIMSQSNIAHAIEQARADIRISASSGAV